jgi:hypothetical protein
MSKLEKILTLEIDILLDLKAEFRKFHNKDPTSLMLKWLKSKNISHPRIKKNIFSKNDMFISLNPVKDYSGFGILIYSIEKNKNSCYIGDFFGGRRHGKGWRLIDGTIYIGEYNYGLKHGEATILNVNSKEVVFEGSFNFNRMHGKCYFKDSEHEFEGEVNNDTYHGPCSIKYANNNFFKGEMDNGRIRGQGKLKYANGDVYKGEFLDNLMHGKGVYTWKNGKTYKGEFRHGKMIGLDANLGNKK